MQKGLMPLSHRNDFLFNRTPRDFIVEEIPLYNFSGTGEHLILKIRKRDLTTWEMIDIVSNSLGVSKREIGYAGLKDKSALTIQYISIPKRYENFLINLNCDKIKILDTFLHSNKLRIGHLKGNRFKLRLKKVLGVQKIKIDSVLDWIESNGMPNYFGEQRFGKDGINYKDGKNIVENKIVLKSRKMREFLISSYQSYLFNSWLSKRVELSLLLEEFEESEVEKIFSLDKNSLSGTKTQKNFFKLLKGDLMMHYPYGKIFWVDEVEKESERFFLQDISPTGLLSGKKVKLSKDVAFNFENSFIDKSITEKGSRRYAWIFPKDIKRVYLIQKANYELEFFLPKGSYATVLIDFLRGRV